MRRRAVDSSSIASIGYDPASGTLEVEFAHGGVYRYFRVSASLHAAFLAAPSKGRFFHAHVRDRFPYARVTTAAAARRGPHAPPS